MKSESKSNQVKKKNLDKVLQFGFGVLMSILNSAGIIIERSLSYEQQLL